MYVLIDDATFASKYFINLSITANSSTLDLLSLSYAVYSSAFSYSLNANNFSFDGIDLFNASKTASLDEIFLFN